MSILLRAYIIDSTYLKTNYPAYVESNIDDNALNQFIIIAQDINLQSNIGYNMYQYILNKLMADSTGSNLSQKYQYILVNYIQPSVALWSIFNAYPTLLYKATNKAIVTKHSDESREVGIRELEYLRNQIRNNAEFMDSRTIEYIMNNIGDFNEYFTTSGVNRIVPKSNNYYGGLYLGNMGGYGMGRNNINNAYENGKGINLNW